MGACNVQTLGVRQQNIAPDLSRPSNKNFAFDLSIPHLRASEYEAFDRHYQTT